LDDNTLLASVCRAWKTLFAVRARRRMPRLKPIINSVDFLEERFGGPPEKER
jgi:hypothetical protein